VARARLERTIRLRALHHYRLPDHSEEENRSLFGDLVDPHPHDWTVTFVLEGEMAPVTGFSVDLPAVDAVLAATVEGWDGGDLNRVIPEVERGEILPSCEGIARWLHGRVSDAIPGSARLVRVRVAESDELAASWPVDEPRPGGGV